MSGITEDRLARSVWFTSERHAELIEAPVLPPAPGEIVVRAAVSLISAGTEMLVYRGESPPDSPLPTMSEGTYTFPVKYGYQVVGVVEEAGEDVALNVGDRVFCLHPHQDLFTIPARGPLVTLIPDSLPNDAAAFENLMEVALTAVHDVPGHIGDVTVIYGMGVVGQLIMQLVRKTAHRLIVVDRNPARLALARELGADLALLPEEASIAIREVSRGVGADVSFEVSGAPQALQAAIESTGQEGVVCAVSYYGDRPVTLRLAPEFHFRRIRIVSSQKQAPGSGMQPRWDSARRTRVAQELLQTVSWQQLVGGRVPLSDVASAYKRIEEDPEPPLGILIDYVTTPR